MRLPLLPRGRAPARALVRGLAWGLAAALAATAAPLRAQEGLRLGVVFGGTGFVGAVAEWRTGDLGAELTLSTFTFRDLGVSAVVKQYFGASWLKPTVGAGLWLVRGGTPAGTGTALVARFPFGGDWRAAHGHYATFELNVLRGLWVRRPDPSDETPINRRMIPIPSASYRWDPR